MIEKFYAAHIKNTLDAAAINVMRPRRARTPSEPKVITDDVPLQPRKPEQRTRRARRPPKSQPDPTFRNRPVRLKGAAGSFFLPFFGSFAAPLFAPLAGAS
jgi:hypothetical protein